MVGGLFLKKKCSVALVKDVMHFIQDCKDSCRDRCNGVSRRGREMGINSKFGMVRCMKNYRGEGGSG